VKAQTPNSKLQTKKRGRKISWGRKQAAQALKGAVAGITEREAIGMVDVLFGQIIAALAAGEQVTISGFGTWRVVELLRVVIKSVIYPTRRTVRFKAGRMLKTTINERP